ncbi:hypothetical protein [Alicyclobacillus ferrooxydans]|uniref:Uncharacterized protein n=1 Tax=Alicyclobacillus ferrooxydans TaxID=471514 RepID=A0A0P9ETI2_9BACL|nr:hypothetical protein [Alicyclobacillus ferrooxydans]KPV42138.1 hypothetical protein AN477_19000 [Alicyclobacillus ferrooxydans]
MKSKFQWTNSMTFVIVVAVILLIGASLVPMRSSLGQGINERVIDAWYGVYNLDTKTYQFRLVFNDGSQIEIPMKSIPQTDFVTKSDSTTMLTNPNIIPAIQAAYQADSKTLQTFLGTYNNAPAVLHPFSDAPVAYSVGVIQAMAKAGFNPKSVGGPNIVPGSVPVAKLNGGSLQIDTAADGNTITQCHPGQVPLQLAQWQISQNH